MTHIDDWLDMPSKDEGERYAKKCIEVFRLPAVEHYKLAAAFRHPPLFCTYGGERWRCIGASRLGDVWLTKDFNAIHGYQLRPAVDNCSEWSATAEGGTQ